MAGMTLAEEQAFASFLRCRLPYREGESDHRLYAFTTYARRVLGQPQLLHWRGLSREDAQVVLRACKETYPKLREPWEHPVVKKKARKA